MTAQRVVVDASIALAWFLPDSANNVLLARRMLEAQENEKLTALVPDFRAAEITYRLLKAARSKPSPLLVSLDQAVAAIDQLRGKAGVMFLPDSAMEVVPKAA